jgi:hypothetical protein
MSGFDEQHWTDKYQIGRARRKRSDQDMKRDKFHAINMINHINSHPQQFNTGIYLYKIY